jgi:DNA-binding transcriptional ArsR family regulator
MSAAQTEQPEPFEALADPTRRGILDLLRRHQTRTAGEIADAFPAISRPAVSRHLRVLRESGLVIAEQSGREWHYRLNVASLARLHRDWFARFTPLWEQSLERLKDKVEGAERAGEAVPSRRKRGA